MLPPIRIDPSDLNGSQLELAHELLSGDAFATLVAGGFGAGKTTSMVLALLMLKTINPDAEGLVIGESFGSLKSTLLRAMRRLMTNTFDRQTAAALCRIHDPTGECFLDLGDGIPIFLRSASNADGFDGLDVGWLVGDEVRHWGEDAFNIAMARVRQRCPRATRVFGSVPEIGLLSEEFRSGKKGRRLIKAPTMENARNLAPDYVDGLRVSYSARMQRAYLDGDFVLLEGAVYDQIPDPFWTSPWVMEAQYVPARKTQLWCDPGTRRSAWLVVQQVGAVDGAPVWCVVDEFAGGREWGGQSDWAMVHNLNAAGYEFDKVVTDPAADADQSAFLLDTMAFLRGLHGRHGKRPPIHTLIPPWNSINMGCDKLRTLLGDPANKIPIRLKVAKHLEEKERTMRYGYVKSLQGYRYAEHRGTRLQTEPLKDGTNDHFCDSARYGATVLWLEDPELRKIDPRLANMNQGYKVA